jgi:hypothetical protein
VTVAGNATLGGATIGGTLSLTGSQAFFGVGGGNYFMDVPSAGGKILYGYNSPKPSSAGAIFDIFDNSTDRNPMFVVDTAGTGGGSSGVYTLHNTLEDGSGNMTANNKMTAAQFCISSSCVSSWAFTPPWSSIANPTTSFNPSMAGYTSTFTFSSALADAFQLYNSTAATSSVSQYGPSFDLSCGNEWHGGASVKGCVSLQFQPGNGTDAASIVALTHTGSATGTVTTSLPGPVSAGGSVGPFIGTEGACSSAVSGSDVLCADATLHAFKSSLNNGSFVAIPQIAGDLGGTASNPTVTNGSHITNSSIPNSGLVNTATTVDGQTCTLGSSCTLSTLNGVSFGASPSTNTVPVVTSTNTTT